MIIQKRDDQQSDKLDFVCESIFTYVIESGDLDYLDGFIDNFEETFINEEYLSFVQEASKIKKGARKALGKVANAYGSALDASSSAQGKIYSFAKRHPTATSAAYFVAAPGRRLGSALGLPGYLGGLYFDVKQTEKLYKHLKKESMTKPKTWIARKIQALRKVYSSWMDKAKVERNNRTAGIIKRACLRLAEIIDYLLRKLQNATDTK